MDRPQKPTRKPKKNEELKHKIPGWGARHPECARFFKSEIHSEQKIGAGVQGQVFKARLPLFGICAVKYFCKLAGGIFVAETDRKAHRELVASQSLSHHPNIVNFYGTVQDDQSRDIGFVTEFMEGGSLFDVINKADANEIGFSDDEWVKIGTRWAIQIARALSYCHSREVPVLHRDVKPENTLLSKDLQTIKLCDFGVARPSLDAPISSNCGTPQYMAPEAYMISSLMKTDYDSSADVFSYAMFLYTLFHKIRPFQSLIEHPYLYFEAIKAEVRPELNETLPLEILNVIKDCWKTKSSDRKTMQEVTETLENYWSRRYPNEEF